MEKINLNLASACSHTPENPLEAYHKYMADEYNKREGNLHLEDGYLCDKCKNRGYIAKAEYTDYGLWTRVDYECECMKTRRNIRRMNRSGLKNVISKYRFDTYNADEQWQRTVKSKAEKFAQRRLNSNDMDDWFFIGGISGAGKTHICTAICREFLLNGLSVKYMLWRDESTKLKSCVNDYDEYDKAIAELKNVDVLYIDDFFKCGYNEKGNQKPTAADINLAFEILNYRYNNPQLITIISSESTLGDIFAIDEAVAGRIGERSTQYLLNLSGSEKNYRRKVMGEML